MAPWSSRDAAAAGTPIRVATLLTAMRHKARSMEIAELAVRYRDSGVVGFDCSGLTQYAYAQAGISIPRNSRAQYSALPKVSRGSLQAGDLVFWGWDSSNWESIHHVAIYLGDGRVLQAPQSGDVVKVSDMWWSGYVGAVRPSA